VPSDEKVARRVTSYDLYTYLEDDLNPIRVLRNQLAEGRTLEAGTTPMSWRPIHQRTLSGPS
jgi:hypothetical protein